MMFQAVNAQMKKMLATASDVNLTPREMEKSKHDAYFVKQYSIGKNSKEGKNSVIVKVATPTHFV